MKKALLIIVVIFLMINVESCKKKSDSPQPQQQSVVGTWIRTYQGVSLTIVFNADLTDSGTWGTIPLPSGTYSVSGMVLSITDEVCPNYGKYNFTLNADTINLTLISDSCDGRYQLVPGTYTRKK
jgi:hypothetical protein